MEIRRIIRACIMLLIPISIIIGCQQNLGKQVVPNNNINFKAPLDPFNNPGAKIISVNKSSTTSRTDEDGCDVIDIGSLTLQYGWTYTGCTDPLYGKTYPNNQYYIFNNNSSLYGFCVVITSGGTLDGYLGSGSTFPFAGGTGKCVSDVGGTAVDVPFLSTASSVIGYVIPLDVCGNQITSATVNFNFQVPGPSPVTWNNNTRTLSWNSVSGVTSYFLNTPNAGSIEYSTNSTSITNAANILELSIGHTYTTTIYPEFSCGQGVGTSYTFTPTACTATPISNVSYNNNTRTLSWNAVAGATSYFLYTPNAGSIEYSTNSASIANVVNILELSINHSYTTTIYPNFPCGQGSGTSYTFTPTACTSTPISNINYNSSTKTLSWTAVPGATSYFLYTPNAGSIEYSTNSTSITNAANILELSTGHTYTTTIYPNFACGQSSGTSYTFTP